MLRRIAGTPKEGTSDDGACIATRMSPTERAREPATLGLEKTTVRRQLLVPLLLFVKLEYVSLVAP